MNKKLFYVCFILVLATSIFSFFKFDLFNNYLALIFNIVIFAIINFILVVIVHELGHLIFGKISKYEFISFRIFNILIYKNKDNKIRLNFVRFNPILFGQCYMHYPYNIDKAPYKLFNAGGLILSYSYSIILLVIIYLGNYNSLFNTFCIVGFFVGNFINLINSVYDKNIINDVCNIYSISNNFVTKKCFFDQLDVLASLSKGEYFNDVIEIVKIEEIDFSITIQIASALFSYYRKMEILKYDEAEVIITKLYENIKVINKLYKDLIIYTYLFHMLVFKNDFEYSDLIIKKHCLKDEILASKKIKSEVDQRVYLAYKIYILKDFTDINEDFRRTKNIIKKGVFEKENYLLDSWVNTMHTYYVKQSESQEI